MEIPDAIDFSMISPELIINKIQEIILSPMNNPELLWVLIPAYINWILRDLFFEKDNSASNVFMNGSTSIWTGVIWLKYLSENTELANFLLDYSIVLPFSIQLKTIISFSLICFGIFLMWTALSDNEFFMHFGRERVISFLIIIFSPIVYDIIQFDFLFAVSSLVFFTCTTFVLFILSKIIPNAPGEN